MEYNVDYFIKKFEAIPEEKWCIGATDDGDGKHCALGHCSGYKFGESSDLGNIFLRNKDITSLLSTDEFSSVYYINDGGRFSTLFGKTPKERILNVLYKIKEKEETDNAIEIVNQILNEQALEMV